MNKICTTIEQSKKLLELGIDVKTADIYYTTFYGKVDRDLPLPKEVYDILKHPINEDKVIPAWSLTALLSLSNSCDLSKERIEEDGSDDRYWFHDDNFHKFSNEYDNPLDAVFEMVVWLKENNLL